MSYEVEDFQKDVLKKFPQPVVVDFGLSGVVPVALWALSWKDWPQKMREMVPGQGQHRDTSGSSMYFQIRSIPAVKLFIDEVVDEFTGALPEASFASGWSKRCPEILVKTNCWNLPKHLKWRSRSALLA